MKARSKELLDRAVAATLAAIEVYNKPCFPYRAESFAVLAINGWELLLKAKWLAEHDNDPNTLYVRETTGRSGKALSKLRIKRTRSGNSLTHSADSLIRKLVETGQFDTHAAHNLEALL